MQQLDILPPAQAGTGKVGVSTAPGTAAASEGGGAAFAQVLAGAAQVPPAPPGVQPSAVAVDPAQAATVPDAATPSGPVARERSARTSASKEDDTREAGTSDIAAALSAAQAGSAMTLVLALPPVPSPAATPEASLATAASQKGGIAPQAAGQDAAMAAAMAGPGPGPAVPPPAVPGLPAGPVVAPSTDHGTGKESAGQDEHHQDGKQAVAKAATRLVAPVSPETAASIMAPAVSGPASPHPAAAAPSVQAGARAPAQQVAEAVARVEATAEGGEKLVVRLSPEELGRVEIVVVKATPDAQAKVVVTAERPETLALLQGDQAALRQALGEAGLDSRTEVTLRLAAPAAPVQAAGQATGQGMDQPSGQGGGAGLEHGAPRTAAADTPPPADAQDAAQASGPVDAPGLVRSPVAAENHANTRHADRDAASAGSAPSGMADAGAGGSGQQGSPGSQRQGEHPGAASQRAAYRAAEQGAGQDSWAADAAWQQGGRPVRQGWSRLSLNITA